MVDEQHADGETGNEAGLTTTTVKITCDSCGRTLRSGFSSTGENIHISCSSCGAQGQLFVEEDTDAILGHQGEITVIDSTA